MSIRMDKYIGFVLDLNESEISENIWDVIVYGECNSTEDRQLRDKLNSVGLKSEYDSRGICKGDFVILYDGISGTYTKLIEVIGISVNCSCDNENKSFTNILNGYLQSVDIHKVTINKMEEIVKAIGLNEDSLKIKCEVVEHFR